MKHLLRYCLFSLFLLVIFPKNIFSQCFYKNSIKGPVLHSDFIECKGPWYFENYDQNNKALLYGPYKTREAAETAKASERKKGKQLNNYWKKNPGDKGYFTDNYSEVYSLINNDSQYSNQKKKDELSLKITDLLKEVVNLKDAFALIDSKVRNYGSNNSFGSTLAEYSMNYEDAYNKLLSLQKKLQDYREIPEAELSNAIREINSYNTKIANYKKNISDLKIAVENKKVEDDKISENRKKEEELQKKKEEEKRLEEEKKKKEEERRLEEEKRIEEFNRNREQFNRDYENRAKAIEEHSQALEEGLTEIFNVIFGTGVKNKIAEQQQTMKNNAIAIRDNQYPECTNCNGLGYVKCTNCNNGLMPCNSFIKCNNGYFDCKACYGTGYINGFTCPSCYGEGKIKCTTCKGKGKVLCTNCDGTGMLICPVCNGTGIDYIELNSIEKERNKQKEEYKKAENKKNQEEFNTNYDDIFKK